MAFVGFSLNPIDWVTSAAGSVLGAVTDGVFDALTGWVEGGLSYIGQQIAAMIVGFGDGDLSGDAFSSLSSMFRYLAVSVVVGTIMVSVAGSLVSKKVELDDVLRHTPATLMMLAGWSAVSALWLAGCRALTSWALGDVLTEGLLAGVSLDVSIASFFRFLIAIVLLIAMAVFAIEMLFIGFLAPFAVAIGPIALALWP